MKKIIKYYKEKESMYKEEVDYSDENLILIITEQIKKVPDCNTIRMIYEECENNIGQVGIYLSNTKDITPNKKYAGITLNEIDLEKEEWKDCTREFQRVKKCIQRHFPLIKCSSNFR